MTQVSRYGHMLKVSITAMRMGVQARYRTAGSVLNDSVMAEMVGAETTLEIDSPDPPERIAKVVHNAERGCFVMQALLQPVSVTGQTLLNGRPLAGDGQGAEGSLA
jgi:organic hydroperoxide reductase OsmC/OhrA